MGVDLDQDGAAEAAPPETLVAGTSVETERAVEGSPLMAAGPRLKPLARRPSRLAGRNLHRVPAAFPGGPVRRGRGAAIRSGPGDGIDGEPQAAVRAFYAHQARNGAGIGDLLAA